MLGPSKPLRLHLKEAITSGNKEKIAKALFFTLLNITKHVKNVENMT